MTNETLDERIERIILNSPRILELLKDTNPTQDLTDHTAGSEVVL